MPCGMRRRTPPHRHSTPAPWSTACAGTPPSRRTRPYAVATAALCGLVRSARLGYIGSRGDVDRFYWGVWPPPELAVGATPLPVTGRTVHVFQHDRLRALSLYPLRAGELVWLVYMTRQPGLVRVLPARRLAEAASLPMIPRRRSRNCGKPLVPP